MTPCSVCGRPGEPLKAISPRFDEDHIERKTRIRWVPAPSPGAACSPECATFVFVRPNDETPDEKRLTSWRWRQRRAEACGEPFDEPQPFDEADRAMILLRARVARAHAARGGQLRLVTP